jgi:hypothetical protein
MKVIVAGSREFNNYRLLRDTLDRLLAGLGDVEIVSGCARGADRLGERYAIERSHAIKRFPADWAEHGRAAGPIRNNEMAKYADMLVAFWDGKSKGTHHMIKAMRKAGKRVEVKMMNGETA